MSTHLEEKLPSRFKEIKEFWDFCIGENPEFDRAKSGKDKWLNNRFPQDADIDGIRLWETVLDIKPNPTETLEDRRFKVITELQKRTPYTWSQLHKMLDALLGKDGYTLKKGYFVLMVYLAMKSTSQLKHVMDLLQEVVPAHILLDIEQILEYYLGIDVYTYSTSIMNLTIVPYQLREYKTSCQASLGSAMTVLADLTIKMRN